MRLHIIIQDLSSHLQTNTSYETCIFLSAPCGSFWLQLMLQKLQSCTERKTRIFNQGSLIYYSQKKGGGDGIFSHLIKGKGLTEYTRIKYIMSAAGEYPFGA